MTEFKSLNQIQSEVFKEYIINGYLDEWTWVKNDEIQKKFDIAELGLIMTEISEAIEEIRKGDNTVDNDKLFIECADIIIRTLNFMSRKNINAQYFILEKNKVNLKREKLHGKEV